MLFVSTHIKNDFKFFFRFCLLQDGDVKLSGSEPSFKGEVQIRLGGVWGPVCDTDWQLSDGDVVCKQLGYSGAKSVYQSETPHGKSLAVIGYS